MADKTIGSLPEATELDSESLMVTEQLGEARRVTGELLAEYAKAAAQEEAEKAETYAQNAAESAQTAEAKAQEAQHVATKPPYIQGENWWVWSEESGSYVDSGIDASVSLSVAETITGAPGTNALVENIGTASDLLLRFTIPRGEKGEVGSVDSVNSKTGDVTLQAKDIPSSAPDGEAAWTDTQAYLDGLNAREKALEASKGQPGGLAVLTPEGKLAQMPDASDVGAVPTERTVNGKPLSADIALNATDVGALPSTEKGQPNGLATLDAEGNLVQSHAEGYKLSVAQGGTGASDPINARSNLGVGKSLWSGNWSSGSITAEGLDAYSIYKIAFSEVGTCAIVSKNGNSIRGLGGNAATATTYRQQYFSAATTGNGTWEKVYFCEYNPVAGSQTQTLTVVQIIGIC